MQDGKAGDLGVIHWRITTVKAEANIKEQIRCSAVYHPTFTVGNQPGICSIYQLEVLLFPLGRDSSPSQGCPYMVARRRYPLDEERQCVATFFG